MPGVKISFLLTLILAKNLFVSSRAFHSYIICRKKPVLALSISFTGTYLLLINAETAQQGKRAVAVSVFILIVTYLAVIISVYKTFKNRSLSTYTNENTC